jgi:hypothetical protein
MQCQQNIFQIPNWKGNKICAARSNNGRIAVVDFRENLIPAATPGGYVPVPVLQKLVRSVHQVDFSGRALGAVTRKLKYYSDLQSLASEDSMTISCLVPIWFAGPQEVARFADWLIQEWELPVARLGLATMDFWRRLPHPQTASRNGSDFDWTISHENFFLLAENEFSGNNARTWGLTKI